jgi:hypothetical protein
MRSFATPGSITAKLQHRQERHSLAHLSRAPQSGIRDKGWAKRITEGAPFKGRHKSNFVFFRFLRLHVENAFPLQSHLQ